MRREASIMKKLDYSIIADYPKENFIEALLSVNGHSSSLRVCFQLTDFKNRSAMLEKHDIRLASAIEKIPEYTAIVMKESESRYRDYCLTKTWEYTDPVLFELFLYEDGTVDYYFSYFGDLEFESINIKEDREGLLTLS
ncbi:hypothetical protein A8A01_27680 [Ewingella americana]|jgi:hypothetical protein|nr:hypothetical protein A8A01_27680 [Ewingella americana]